MAAFIYVLANSVWEECEGSDFRPYILPVNLPVWVDPISADKNIKRVPQVAYVMPEFAQPTVPLQLKIVSQSKVPSSDPTESAADNGGSKSDEVGGKVSLGKYVGHLAWVFIRTFIVGFIFSAVLSFAVTVMVCRIHSRLTRR